MDIPVQTKEIKRVKRPNPMDINLGYGLVMKFLPWRFNLKDARKAHEWLGRLVQYLEQQENDRRN